MDGVQKYPLVFRVMRLARPNLATDNCLRIDLIEDMGPDRPVQHSKQSSVLPASLMSAYAERVQLPSAVEAMNVTGKLLLPDSFGRIYLGENFSSYITLNNQWDQVVSNIQVKIVLDMGNEEEKVLYDTQSSALPSLAPGEHHDFYVKHDLKAVGTHSLVCNVNYTGSDGERRHSPQYFKFPANNPVLVRTKTRQAGRATFLEASVENQTKSPMFLDYIKLLPEEHLQVEQLAVGAVLPAGDPHLNPLLHYINSLQIIDPGGSTTFLFKVLPKEAAKGGEGEDILGRLEMLWRSTLGASGLLQTQKIRHHVPPPRPAQIKVVRAPHKLACDTLFRLDLRIHNNTDKELAGLRLHVPDFRPTSPPVPTAETPRTPAAMAAGGMAGEGNILLQGAADMPLGELGPRGDQPVSLTLVPLAPGLQRAPLMELRHPDLGVLDTLSLSLLVC